jgi:hypothetical protein
MIFDHLSLSWWTDEAVGIYQKTGEFLTDITVSRTIMSEGYRGHAVAMQISGGRDYDTFPVDRNWQKVQNIDVLKNLFVHNTHRNPRVGSRNARVINNVVYNFSNRWMETMGGVSADVINNFVYVGAPMRPDVDEVVPDFLLQHEEGTQVNPWPDPKLHVTGNILYSVDTASYPHPLDDPLADNYAVAVRRSDSEPEFQLIPEEWKRADPSYGPETNVLTANEAWASIIGAGDVGNNARVNCAGSWVPRVGSVDQRILNEVATLTGPSDAITHVTDVGGYPTLATGTGCADTDNDGMPDNFETNHGFDPVDPADGPLDRDGDGYTNVEEFYNGTGTP